MESSSNKEFCDLGRLVMDSIQFWAFDPRSARTIRVVVSTRLVDVIENIDPSKISGMKEFPQEVLRVCEGILAGSIGQRKRVFERGSGAPLVILGNGAAARAIHESDIAGTVRQWSLARKCADLWRKLRGSSRDACRNPNLAPHRHPPVSQVRAARSGS